jgi:hypothetical protein
MAGLGTGIVKNTNGTGVPSIAVAGDFPTLNQSTSGTAANATNVITNIGGTALASAWSVVGADQSGAGTAAANAAVSGTSGYGAKFTGSHAVGNSLYQDNGTTTAINGAPRTNPTLTLYAPSAGNACLAGVDAAGQYSFYLNPNKDGSHLLLSSDWFLGSAYLPFCISGRENVNDLQCLTNGNISMANNVGIGTASPDSQLTVSAGAHIGGGLLVEGAATINNNVTVNNNSNSSYYMTMTGGTGVENIISTTGLNLQGYNSYNFIIGNNYASTYQMNATGMNCYGNDTVGGDLQIQGNMRIESGNVFANVISSSAILTSATITQLMLSGQNHGVGCIIYDTAQAVGSATTINWGSTPNPVYIVSSGSPQTVSITNPFGYGGSPYAVEITIINIGSTSITIPAESGSQAIGPKFARKFMLYNGKIYQVN